MSQGGFEVRTHWLNFCLICNVHTMLLGFRHGWHWNGLGNYKYTCLASSLRAPDFVDLGCSLGIRILKVKYFKSSPCLSNVQLNLPTWIPVFLSLEKLSPARRDPVSSTDLSPNTAQACPGRCGLTWWPTASLLSTRPQPPSCPLPLQLQTAFATRRKGQKSYQ